MIRPVIDEESYRQALTRIQEIWNAKPGSRDALELDALATLVDAYERQAFPILPPDPIEAILARCEQLGWTRKELEPIIGSRARVSEVLTRRRALTLPMIRRLHTGMGIPADLLIAEIQDRRPKRRTRSRAKSNTLRRTKTGAQHAVAADGRARLRSPARS